MQNPRVRELTFRHPLASRSISLFVVCCGMSGPNDVIAAAAMSRLAHTKRLPFEGCITGDTCMRLKRKAQEKRHRDPVDGDRDDERFPAKKTVADVLVFAATTALVSSSPFHSINYPLQKSHYFQVIILLSIRFLFRCERIRLFLFYLCSHLLYCEPRGCGRTLGEPTASGPSHSLPFQHLSATRLLIEIKFFSYARADHSLSTCHLLPVVYKFNHSEVDE